MLAERPALELMLVEPGPDEGVVDGNCLVYGTDNLYVAGSSVFPTGSAANPTFMIVTLAHRLVDHLSGQRSG